MGGGETFLTTDYWVPYFLWKFLWGVKVVIEGNKVVVADLPVPLLGKALDTFPSHENLLSFELQNLRRLKVLHLKLFLFR